MKKILIAITLAIGVNTLYSRDLRSDTIDLCSVLLKINLSDFSTRIMQGEATIGIKAKTEGVEGIRLDLLHLTVDSVIVDGYHAPYTYNDSLLDINLLTYLHAGDSATLKITYHGTPLHETGDFGGFYWTGQYAFNIGVSFLADPHNYGRVWFPCFDNFEERSYYEFFITTKNTHKAFCNGLLQGVTTAGSNKTWHWKLSRQIPSYLTSVTVSDYQTLTDTVNGINGTIPVELAARATDTTALKNLFVHLHDAFHIQEKLWGPYRWDRVGYCIVPFNAGAMEHATNISFMQYFLNVLAADCEETMAHELSHHWFGNLVTCDSAPEMWLNEGWARYNEKLFLENYYGRELYRQSVAALHEDVLHRAHVRDNAYLPVSGVPTESTYGATVYDKGSDMIHTLRWYMGDSLFFNCVKGYLNQYAGTTASTANLRDYLKQCSGINLDDYFNNWIYSPGFTHLSLEKVSMTQQGTDNYVVDIDIRQRLSHAPAYYNNVPVKVSYFSAGRQRRDEVVMVSGECTHHQAAFNMFVPFYVAIDFDENLQDAISDNWYLVADTGNYDFGVARISLQAQQVLDTALVRIEHNWIAPDAMRQPIEGLHLHSSRYWTIDGTWSNTFKANATVAYDGSSGAYLDETFFTNSEDSLVIMYRDSQDKDWAPADSFTINKAGNASDKTGTATIYNIKKGEYSLAIWNSALPAASYNRTPCNLQSGIAKVQQNTFGIYPNPAGNIATLAFEPNLFSGCSVADISGRILLTERIGGQAQLQLNVKNLAPGTYLVSLKTNNGQSITKKLVKTD